MALGDSSAQISDVTAIRTQKDGGAHVASTDSPHEAFACDSEPDITAINDFGFTYTPETVSWLANVPGYPLFACNNDDLVVFDDVLLFSAPASADGRVVDVYGSCARGLCTCVHYLHNVRCQLHPCRFAYLLYGGFISDVRQHEVVYDGICDGFKIVDEVVEPYE